jgi:hypothetical protein
MHAVHEEGYAIFISTDIHAPLITLTNSTPSFAAATRQEASEIGSIPDMDIHGAHRGEGITH